MVILYRPREFFWYKNTLYSLDQPHCVFTMDPTDSPCPTPDCRRGSHRSQWRLLAGTACIACLVVACTTGPVSQGPGADSADIIESLPPDTGEITIYTPRLDRAEELLARRQLLPAASILRELENGKLTAGERARSLAMETELEYLQGNTEKALARLEQTLPALGAISPNQRTVLEDWLLRLTLSEQGPLAAATLADRLLLATEDELRGAALVDFIWRNLQRVPAADLEEQLLAPVSPHWSGWLELALLAADVMESPDMQVAQLELWQERHRSHRAAEVLPGGLEALLENRGRAPTRVALLLPLSGGPSAEGQALLQGYLAALYEGRRRGWPEQELMVMDSAAQPDFNAAYDIAVRAGAELVIGPLTREELLSWQPRPDSEVPLMTLAWHPELPEVVEVAVPDPAGGEQAGNDGGEEMLTGVILVELPPPVQLDLAPTDEARQLAQLAYDSGARNALVIKPAGEWGDSMADTLIQAWNAREGTIQAIATYSGQADYSSSLKAALKLNDSEERASKVRQLLGERTEFTPRRRKDIDIVFLLSNDPQDARSIKPLIAFHYAGDLPVYATSHVFSGKRDPQRDRDLNGIQLVEIPWVLTPEGELRGQLEDGREELLANLHALGADAFMLNWRLAQFRASPEARIRGNTGLLNMDKRGRIHRELMPARIRNGVPEPL